MNYSPPGSSVHGGFFPSKNTGGGCSSSSRGFSWPRDRTRVQASWVSCFCRWILLPLSHRGSQNRTHVDLWPRNSASRCRSNTFTRKTHNARIFRAHNMWWAKPGNYPTSIGRRTDEIKRGVVTQRNIAQGEDKGCAAQAATWLVPTDRVLSESSCRQKRTCCHLHGNKTPKSQRSEQLAAGSQKGAPRRLMGSWLCSCVVCVCVCLCIYLGTSCLSCSPCIHLWYRYSYLVVQMVKNLPAMREILVQPLGREDPLEKGMDTHSSVLTWWIPCIKEPGRLQSMGWQRGGHDWMTYSHIHTHHPVDQMWKCH